MNDLAVKVNELYFNYSDKPGVLNGISFSIEEGETVALIGHNGAGKTTLFLHLNALLQPLSGEIEVLGISLSDKALHREVRQKVGIVFQNPEDQLFSPTVFDDVAFGPLNHGLPIDETRKKVESALLSVNMLKARNRPSHHLSFGEKRLVAIASVLSTDPEMLMFDEPSSNLDPLAQQKLVELINALNMTKIIATHDFELILETCDRVLLMHQGKITANGPPGEVLYDEELLENNGLALPFLMKQLKKGYKKSQQRSQC